MEEVYEVRVEDYSPTVTNITTNSNTSTGFNYTYPYYTYPYWSVYPTTIYKYQIKCPKKFCKRMNWLELDKVTPCTNCGSKLQAVSQKADFTIEVE